MVTFKGLPSLVLAVCSPTIPEVCIVMDIPSPGSGVRDVDDLSL